MNFQEAFCEMLKGKKVRCTSWYPKVYWYMNVPDTNIWVHTLDAGEILKTPADILDTLALYPFCAWEVYQNIFDTQEAIKQMNKGNKVRRLAWSNIKYIFIKNNIFTIDYDNGEFVNSGANFIMSNLLENHNDWILVQ